MNIQLDMCCICLCKKKVFHDLSGTDRCNITYFNKLTSTIPEMCFDELNNQTLVCNECLDTIDIIYEFRQVCLKNKTIFINHITKLRLTNNVNKRVIDLTENNQPIAYNVHSNSDDLNNSYKNTEKNNHIRLKNPKKVVSNIDPDYDPVEPQEDFKIDIENHIFTEYNNKNTTKYINENYNLIDTKTDIEINTNNRLNVDCNNKKNLNDNFTEAEFKINSVYIKTEENMDTKYLTDNNGIDIQKSLYDPLENLGKIKIECETKDMEENIEECFSSTIENREDIANETELNSENDFSISGTPPEILELANTAALNLLPFKSREKYERSYRRFMDFCQDKYIGSHSENVVLAYFVHLSSSLKASTLWANYSMLRTTLNIKENVDISKFMKLRAFLKRQSDGFKTKKSKILNMEQIKQFITEAPDDTFLITKVALIFGVSGACRREELAHMQVKDIKDLGSKLLINIPDNKTNKPRSFIVNEIYLEIYRKYTASRPTDFDSSRFFFKYAKGKGCKQVVGLHQFGKMPQIVANFLNLANPTEYTGHCFRRSSANILVDSGPD